MPDCTEEEILMPHIATEDLPKPEDMPEKHVRVSIIYHTSVGKLRHEHSAYMEPDEREILQMLAASSMGEFAVAMGVVSDAVREGGGLAIGLLFASGKNKKGNTVTVRMDDVCAIEKSYEVLPLEGEKDVRKALHCRNEMKKQKEAHADAHKVAKIFQENGIPLHGHEDE
jgi:hypothetical protein